MKFQWFFSMHVSWDFAGLSIYPLSYFKIKITRVFNKTLYLLLNNLSWL